MLSRLLRGRQEVRSLRKESKRRHWAIELRVALVVLFTLAWVAERTGASVLIAGFGAGLMVAAVGGPKRMSTQVLGVAGGFFIPLFFVLLGARIRLRGFVEHPSTILLIGLLVVLTVGVHELTSLLTRQRLAAGLVASAQLGVSSAVAALGRSEHLLTATQAAAIITAAMITIVIGGAAAARMARTHGPPRSAARAASTTRFDARAITE
jgi:Kef-type K+ transport system membrane component KefB